MRTSIKIIIGLLVCLTCVTGCMQRESIVKNQYMIHTDTPAAQTDFVAEAIVTVMPFSINPAFQSTGFVYRTGPSKFETDFYNEYFISPSQMLSGQTRNWLAACGFKVVPATSHAAPDYMIEGNIRKMYADYQDASGDKAVLEIFFTVIRPQAKENELIFSKTYTAATSLPDGTAEAYVESMNQCLFQVLGELEKDLKSIRSQ